MLTTGIYFRVKRDGKWDTVLFEDLTLNERRSVLKGKDHHFIVDVASKLADVIDDANKYLL